MVFKLFCISTIIFVVIKTTNCESYDENYAKMMFYLSSSAYADDHQTCLDNRKQEFLPHKFEWIDSQLSVCDSSMNECAYFAVVSEVTKQLVIAFRGTYTGLQLITEGLKTISFPLENFFNIGSVNPYFRGVFDALYDKVEILLKNPKYKDYNVTFTGHSLGGAAASLASIATVLRKHRNSSQVNLYTLGQPRVGNSEFAFNHDKLVPQSYRLVLRQDIVPHLPFCSNKVQSEFKNRKYISTKEPCNANDPYSCYHHQTEIWYPNNMTSEGGGDYKVCTGKPKDEDSNCSDYSFPDTIWPGDFMKYIADHSKYFGLSGEKGLGEFGETCTGSG